MSLKMNSGRSKLIAAVLVCFLIGNLIDLWLLDVGQPANAQPVIIGHGVPTSNTLTLNPRSSISGTNNINNINNPNFTPQALTETTTCNNNQVRITIDKEVIDNTNNPNARIFTFTIARITTSDGLKQIGFTGPSDTQQFCVNVGDTWRVVETTTSPQQGFSFTTDYTSTPVSTPSNSCNGQAQTNQDITCTVTNTITSNQGLPITNPDNNQPAQSDTTTSQVFTPQSLSDSGPTQSSAAAGGRRINPPFQTCAANTITGTVPSSLNNANGKDTDVKTIVRAPSDALYLIRGAIPLDQIKEAMTSLHNTNTITIVLMSDINNDDGVSTRVDNPQFMGKVIVTDDKDPVKQKVIKFNVDAVRTECKFITLANTIGNPPNNVRVAPLGQTKNLSPGSVKASDINKLVVGGPKVTSTLSTVAGNNLYPAALNPPFATCQTPTSQDAEHPDTSLASSDSLALYNVRGTILDKNALSGDRLTVQIVADLVPIDSDLAKIVNSNNPYIKVNLISQNNNPNENNPNAQLVPFTMKDLWTECKAISLASETVFQAAPDEISP